MSEFDDTREDLPWYEAADLIRAHVVRISTPRGSGTGFLVSYGPTSQICGIATAAHVVDAAHYWEEPIRIDHTTSGNSLLVRAQHRAVFLDPARDTAALLFSRADLPLPAETLPLIKAGDSLRVGNDIGWLGYPAVAPEDLCFFGGKVSAWREQDRMYLVDGVAINGVSGGPAFYASGGTVTVIGVVSAYAPNRATGEVLPGLAVIRDVAQFHELAPTFESLEQAKSEESTPQGEPTSNRY
jgi:hypothetical protein